MNEISHIEGFIYQTMVADSILQALVEDRVFSHHIPREAELPAVVFQFQGGADSQGTGTHRHLARPIFTIKAVGSGDLADPLVNAADRIDDIFQSAVNQAYEGVLISSRRIQPVRYMEPGGESETVFSHIGGMYRFDSYASGSPGSGGEFPPQIAASLITDEVPAGLVNGSNTIFTTAHSFAPDSIEAEVNGVGQIRGVDFIVTPPNTITFITAPQTGDSISVDYRRV